MTYVVERRSHRRDALDAAPDGAPDGRRYEIRESALTDRGPRARSLATFGVLDDVVLARARARALQSFDAERVRASARRIGAPVVTAEPAERHARALIADLRIGHAPPPALAAVLRQLLARGYEPDDTVEAVVPWIGATTAERGEALRDLLDLADQIPTRRRPPSQFPRLSSAS